MGSVLGSGGHLGSGGQRAHAVEEVVFELANVFSAVLPEQRSGPVAFAFLESAGVSGQVGVYERGVSVLES